MTQQEAYDAYQEALRRDIERYRQEHGHSVCGPHCDDLILHAPAECESCDAFPGAQYARQSLQINFTGQNTPGLFMCPAEARRPLKTINKWSRNRASKD